MNSKSSGLRKSKFQRLFDMIFTNWHFMRWLRLGIGMYLVWQLAIRPDIFTGLVAAFLLFQAITNTGCCGAAGCSVPAKKTAPQKSDEVTYEEIK